jgi:hypothetical protein
MPLMKALLVSPEFPNTFWSFRHALSFEGKRAAFPPLGLLTVAALLPPSWERRLVDLNVRPLSDAENEQLLAELDVLLRLGWRGPVFLVDDNFIGNKPQVKRLLPELAECSTRHRHPFAFLTEASINLAEDEELLAGMRRAGFRRVFLGIETPSASIRVSSRNMRLK